jgi:hypothetical protein
MRRDGRAPARQRSGRRPRPLPAGEEGEQAPFGIGHGSRLRENRNGRPEASMSLAGRSGHLAGEPSLACGLDRLRLDPDTWKNWLQEKDEAALSEVIAQLSSR